MMRKLTALPRRSFDAGRNVRGLRPHPVQASRRSNAVAGVHAQRAESGEGSSAAAQIRAASPCCRPPVNRRRLRRNGVEEEHATWRSRRMRYMPVWTEGRSIVVQEAVQRPDRGDQESPVPKVMGAGRPAESSGEPPAVGTITRGLGSSPSSSRPIADSLARG